MANRRRRAPSASTTSISSNGRRRVSSRLVRAGRRTETGRGRAARSPLLPGERRREGAERRGWESVRQDNGERGKSNRSDSQELNSGADIQTPHDRDTKQPAQIGSSILHPVSRKFMCQQTTKTHMCPIAFLYSFTDLILSVRQTKRSFVKYKVLVLVKYYTFNIDIISNGDHFVNYLDI